MKKLFLVAFLGILSFGLHGEEIPQSSVSTPIDAIYKTSAFGMLVDAMVDTLQQVNDYASSGIITKENINEVTQAYKNASKRFYFKIVAALIKFGQGKERNSLDIIKREAYEGGVIMNNAWHKARDRFHSGLPEDEKRLLTLRDIASNLTLSESGPDRVIINAYIRALEKKLYGYLLDKDGNLIECR